MYRIASPPAAPAPTFRARFRDRAWTWCLALLGLFVGVAVAAQAQETSISIADGQVVVTGPGTFELPFVIERGGELTDGVRILLETAEGGSNPATPGEDYTPLPPGTEVLLDLDETGTTVNVEVLGGAAPEPDETLLLLLTGAQAFHPTPRLTPTALHARVGNFPTSMAVADLNGDGHPDVVTGNGLSFDVSVLLSDGAGDFLAAVSYPVAGNVAIGRIVVAIGDITADGNPDIVATGFNPDAIEVFAGDGAGEFADPVPFPLGTADSPTAVAVTDVTGDGNLDVITANGGGNDVSVLAGDGAGGVGPAQSFPTGSFPNALAIADVNGDGNPDLTTANGGSRDVSVLIGDGAGGFAPPQHLGIGLDATPLGVTVADATGDGNPDIVTANQFDDGGFPPPETPGSASVLAGDGGGGFAEAEQFPLGEGPGRAQSVAVGDVTGEGDPDIVASRPIDNSVSVLAGDGAGGFAPLSSIPTGVGPYPVAIVDMNGDANLDVVTANVVSANVSVLPGDGAGNLGFPGNYDVGTFPHSVTAADLNGDGLPDVATANAFSNDVSVLLNDGAGGLAGAVGYPVGTSPTWITVGDIDGNAIPDLITANLGGGDVSVLLGDGVGGFADAIHVGVGGDFESPYAVAVADINGDGHQDVATANTNISNSSISVLLGDGAGGFAEPLLIQGASEQSQSIDLADVTGDGNVDIVVPSFEFPEGKVALLAGDGTGGFADPVHFTVDTGPVFVLAADVTDDGNPDLVSLNHTAQTVSVLAGDGAGGFADAVHFPIFDLPGNPCSVDPSGNCPWPWGLNVSDVNGDGRLDIITANTDNGTVSILPNDGAGGFPSFEYFDTGALPGAVAVADITGDGNPDVITSNREGHNVSVLANGLSRVELLDGEALGTIITDVTGGGPVADITPAAFAFEVPQGGSDSDTLSIGNIGDADLDWSLTEAEGEAARRGALYTYGLRGAPEFHAPVGFDRASGITRSRGQAPADPIVLPAPQPRAIGDFSEGFDDITQLPGAGWALINNSEPVGPSSWFQGNDSIFPAHEGEPDAYIAANFESTDDVGTISNWLITPEVTIANGTTITFWTRKAELFEQFADRMEVRMSVAGASTDVGDTAESVGDFTEVLLTINPDLIPGEYPQEWTQFTLTVRERSREPVTGRFAFRYWVTEAGPDGTNADYIGIDTVSVTQPDGEPPTGGCENPLDISWLAADPTSGTTAPSASEPVIVSVDSTGLEPGDYSAQLCVNTNDPNAPLVTVPVSLTVTGGTPGPVADISPGAFEFEIPAGGSAGDVLNVGNAGTADLVWSVDEAEEVFAPGAPAGGRGRAASAGTMTPTGLHPAAMPRVPASAVLASHLDPGLVRNAMGHRFRRMLPAPRFSGARLGRAAGGAASWSSLGPPGGDVADVAVSTVDPQIVLAGVVPLPFYSGGTLYRSSDGGVTWTEVSALAGISVYSIEFTPAGDVYTATHDGVWESNDGGQTWIRHEIEISLNPQVLALAIDPSDPATLWAGVVTHPNAPLSLVRSHDGGETWEDRTPPLTQPLHGSAIAVAPNDSNTVIATFSGDFDSGEIWVSTDAGATWTNRSAGLPGNPLYDVVYDGSRLLVSGGLWFLDQPVGLYESNDLGVSWTPLHDSTWPQLLVEDIAVDPNDAATILVATYGGGINRSTDGGATWEIGIGGSGAVLAHSLRFQPGTSEVLFVGTSPQGVLRSLDGGDQFNASADGISELDFASIDSNPLAPAELAIAYQGQNYGGVLSSVDGGTTWQPEPVPSAGSAVARFAPDGSLYTVATGPSGASQGLYRRKADGTWTWLGPDPEGQSASLFLAVRFSVNDPGLILLGGMDVGTNDFEATIWRSGDGGQSWTKVFEAAPDSGAWVIDLDVVEDGSDQVMLATFSERFGDQGGVLRSADGGLTWLHSTAGLPAGELGEPELCASVGDPQVFYLSLSPSFLQNQLFRTADGGVSWEPTGWSGAGRTGAVACDRVDSQVLYLGLLDVPAGDGNRGEVWRSVDGGVTFEPFTDGLPGGAAPRDLAFTGTSRLLLASDKGTWATDLGGGGGGCADPADVPWLSFAPASGVTPPGDSVPVDVLVDTAGLDEGEHAARLCVTTNDPAAPLVEIPVHLTVTPFP